MNIISNALGHVLRIIFELVQNYGLSIILFTIVVKVLLLPLTIKQTKSTKAMQDIQPKILEIQTKYMTSRTSPYPQAALPTVYLSHS